MHKHLLIAVAVATSSLVAQNNLSSFLNMGVTFTSRNGANFVPATIYTRINKDNYAGWGVDATQPGMRVFTGLRFDIQDQDLATQDTYQLTAFTESTTPHVPNTAAPIATTGNFTLPVGTGAGAYLVSANFATPIAAPASADVFVGVSTTLGWTNPITDGLSIWATAGDATSALRDEAGFGEPITTPGNTYSGQYTPSTTTHGFGARRQSHIEPIFASPAGVASALHYNDPVHANANTFPGTTCMHSALNPDSRSPSRIAGRADDVGMTFRHAGIPDGSLVFFIADIAPSFGTEFPLSMFLANSLGAVCVNLGSAQTIALGFTASTTASNVITFSAASRALLSGLPVIQQAIGLDVTTNVGYASPCTKQTL
jgi:hypothetical protein